jgi:hypothetical protein
MDLGRYFPVFETDQDRLDDIMVGCDDGDDVEEVNIHAIGRNRYPQIRWEQYAGKRRCVGRFGLGGKCACEEKRLFHRLGESLTGSDQGDVVQPGVCGLKPFKPPDFGVILLVVQ